MSAHPIFPLPGLAPRSAPSLARSLVRAPWLALWLSGLVSALPAQQMLPVPPGFVYAQGTQLMLGGTPFHHSGTNNYYLMNQPDAMIDAVLDDAVSLGFKSIRMWAFMNGTTTGASGWHSGHTIQLTPRSYHESGLVNIDYALAGAANRGLKLVLTLVNYWPEYGGMDVYAGWAGVDREAFYTDPRVRSIYKDYLAMITQRVNTITGIRYRDDPTILAWNLTNEARSTDPTGVTITNWAREMSDYLRSLDPHHLISLGDEGGYAYEPGQAPDYGYEYTGGHGTDWKSIIALPNIDYGTFHHYGLDWWGKDLAWSLRWVEHHVADAHAVGKPVIMEEVGKLIPVPFDGNDDSTRVAGIQPLMDRFLELKGAAVMTWMLVGRDTANPLPGNPLPLYRDRWDDGFQFSVQDPLTSAYLTGFSAGMAALNLVSPGEIDDFEHYASSAALQATWVRNPSGGLVTPTLAPAPASAGDSVSALALDYNYSGYAGLYRSVASLDWRPFAGIAFHLVPDGSGRALTFQFLEGPAGGSEYWESSLQLHGTAPLDVFLPFEAFQKPSWNTTGNGQLDLGEIESVAFYLGAPGGSGRILIDHLSASPVTYAGWSAARSLSGGGADDDDGDGLPNLLEYAFGQDPKNATPHAAAFAALSAPAAQDGERLSFQFKRPAALPADVSIVVQLSQDLITWTDAINGTDYTETSTGNPLATVSVQVLHPLTTYRFARVCFFTTP